MDYVQLQQSVSCSDSRCLNLVKEIKSLQLQQFLQFIPVTGSRELEGKVSKLGVGFRDDQLQIHLLERVLRVGVAIVTSELR
jgi:hypothetical protein